MTRPDRRPLAAPPNSATLVASQLATWFSSHGAACPAAQQIASASEAGGQLAVQLAPQMAS